MPQTGDELKSALKLAAKATPDKPHFFAMVIKGGVEGALIVDKRKVVAKLVDEAKKKYDTTTVIRGLCFGEDDKIVFETAKAQGSTAETMAKRLANVHAGLTIKPLFKVGRGEDAADEPVDTPTSPASLPQAKGSDAPPSVEDPAKKAWDELLKRVQPKVVEVRDTQPLLLPKIAPLFEFAVEKGRGGDYGTATAALKKLLETIASGGGATPASTGGKAKTTQRGRAPIEPEAARDFISKIDADEDEEQIREASANLLDDMKTALTKAKRLVSVPSLDALAQAMATANNISKSEAAQMIANNRGRGFTAPDGTVYVLGNVPESGHDEVHETVHLMSAPGGKTQIMAEYGEQLNEAFTEYFTKQMCAKLGVPDAASYPEHVAFMNKLAPVVGYGALYTAYMKNGGFDPVLQKLIDVWVGKADTLDKAQKPPATNGAVDRAKARTFLAGKFKNGFPPEGPAMNFWNKVFFA